MEGADGIVREWSVGAERLFGYARAEAIGARFAQLVVPPHLRPQRLAGIARYVETGQSQLLGKRTLMPALVRGGGQIQMELAILRVPQSDPLLFAAYLRCVPDGSSPAYPDM